MSTDILFVDDDPVILAGFQRSLRKDFSIETATGGAEGLAKMRGRTPYAVVVSDMRMPTMNGIQFLVELQRQSPDTVRIMLTGNADQQTARDAVNRGQIYRFLNKPCPHEDLVLALRAGLKQYRLITAERDVLERTLNGCARMLSDLLATHDPQAFGQSQRLREHMKAFADHLKLPQTWDLELAAMLSQIGYVTIPQAVLTKSREGGQLDGAEMDMIARVPQIGYNLLSHIPRLESVATVVLYQSKNFDGTGFPSDGVSGEDIPIGSRILRVLKELQMFGTDWSSHARAFEILSRDAACYDPRVVDAVAAIFDVSFDRDAPSEIECREVHIENLRIGLTFGASVRTVEGTMIVPAGTQITPMLLEKLRNFANLKTLEQPMKVTC